MKEKYWVFKTLFWKELSGAYRQTFLKPIENHFFMVPRLKKISKIGTLLTWQGVCPNLRAMRLSWPMSCRGG
jgi:hypothetical protein